MNRFEYVKYDEIAIADQAAFKSMCEKLAASIEVLPSGRAQCLALNKLEECYMWIGKALRDAQVERNGR
jgi:hypothetical protein